MLEERSDQTTTPGIKQIGNERFYLPPLDERNVGRQLLARARAKASAGLRLGRTVGAGQSISLAEDHVEQADVRA